MFFECGLDYLEKWMKHAATCSNMQQHAFLEVAETCKKNMHFPGVHVLPDLGLRRKCMCLTSS
jgi:hypothetical protein